jgi:hypothetical protein
MRSDSDNADPVVKKLIRTRYLTDAAGVESLASHYASALSIGQSIRNSYLRVLVAGVQQELGQDPRMTARGKAGAVDVQEGLAAVRKVHAEYYAAVLRGVTTKDITDEDGLRKQERKLRAKERNRRSNFARSALSLLRAYVKAGGNPRSIVVPTATKAQLAAYVAKHQEIKEPAVRSSRIALAVNRVLEIAEAVKSDDQAEAVALVQSAIASLSHRVGEWTKTTTSSPRKAVAQGIMLRTRQGIFWPVGMEAGQAEARLALSHSAS